MAFKKCYMVIKKLLRWTFTPYHQLNLRSVVFILLGGMIGFISLDSFLDEYIRRKENVFKIEDLSLMNKEDFPIYGMLKNSYVVDSNLCITFYYEKKDWIDRVEELMGINKDLHFIGNILYPAYSEREPSVYSDSISVIVFDDSEKNKRINIGTFTCKTQIDSCLYGKIEPFEDSVALNNLEKQGLLISKNRFALYKEEKAHTLLNLFFHLGFSTIVIIIVILFTIKYFCSLIIFCIAFSKKIFK